jgi:hypothetical protein
MTQRLPDVLDERDLPSAELCAARLDGELFPVAGGLVVATAPDLPSVRAALARGGLPDRVVVERRSAAWVHGARALPPARHAHCVSSSARAQPGAGALREVRFAEGELRRLGEVLVTSPLRTVLDLVRADEPLDDQDERSIRELLRIAGSTAEEAAAVLAAQRKLPGKVRALARLRALAAAQPAETL